MVAPIKCPFFGLNSVETGALWMRSILLKRWSKNVYKNPLRPFESLIHPLLMQDKRTTYGANFNDVGQGLFNPHSTLDKDSHWHVGPTFRCPGGVPEEQIQLPPITTITRPMNYTLSKRSADIEFTDRMQLPYDPFRSTQPQSRELANNHLSLSSDDDGELPTCQELATSVAKPVSKVAGSRRPTKIYRGKGKGKARADSPPPATGKRKREESLKISKKGPGRTAGVKNYSDLERDKMLDLVEEFLPLGEAQWKALHTCYKEFAEENGYLVRNVMSLQDKFRKIVRTRKPTGEARLPDYVRRALKIDAAITEKADTGDLDDNISDDEHLSLDSSSEDDSDEPPPPKKAKSGTKSTTDKVAKKENTEAPVPIARRITERALSGISTRQTHNTGQDLISAISDALGPEARDKRSEDASARFSQASQLFALNGRIRDLERLNESLRTQLSNTQQETADARRRADVLEIKLDLLEHDRKKHSRSTNAHSHSQSLSPHRSRCGRPHGSCRSPTLTKSHRQSPSTSPDGGYVVHEVRYPEGGSWRQVYRANEITTDDEVEMSGVNDPVNSTRVVLEDTISAVPFIDTNYLADSSSKVTLDAQENLPRFSSIEV